MLAAPILQKLVSVAAAIAIERPTATARERAELALKRTLPYLAGNTAAWDDAIVHLEREVSR